MLLGTTTRAGVVPAECAGTHPRTAKERVFAQVNISHRQKINVQFNEKTRRTCPPDLSQALRGGRRTAARWPLGGAVGARERPFRGCPPALPPGGGNSAGTRRRVPRWRAPPWPCAGAALGSSEPLGAGVLPPQVGACVCEVHTGHAEDVSRGSVVTNGV